MVSVRYMVGRRLGGLWYLSGTGLAGGWMDGGICQYRVGRRLGGLWYLSGTWLVGGWVGCFF